MNESHNDDMFSYEEEQVASGRKKPLRTYITRWDVKEWYYGSRYMQKKLSRLTVDIFLDFYTWLEKANVKAILKALRREE